MKFACIFHNDILVVITDLVVLLVNLNTLILLTLPSLAGVAALKSLITLYINICKITFFPSTQFAYIYAIIFICKLCYKDKLGQTYIYICILSGRKNVINMLSYLSVSCVTRINLDKHIYMHIEWKQNM